MANSESDATLPIFRGLAIGELISRPLMAVTRANERMAKQQVKFLMETCFHKEDGVYEPVMINMSISRGVLEPQNEMGPPVIEPITVNFQVPLITILPLNSLGVEEANLQFYMDVFGLFEIDKQADGGLFVGSPPSNGQVHELAGSIGPRGAASEDAEVGASRDANIAVEVVAGALPLPKGVLILLDAYSKAIYPSDASERKDG